VAQPDISVVIATCNRNQTLTEAIDSALSQSGVDLEVLVVDDSRNQAARAVVNHYSGKVRYLARGSPSGGRPGLVRNEGLRHASRSLVHFLDDDDALEPGALAALAVRLACAEAAFAFGRVRCFGPEAAVVDQQRFYDRGASNAERLGSRTSFARQLMFGDTPLITSACLSRRDALLAQGGFAEELQVCEDVELFLRLGRHGGFSFLPQVVLNHRVGEPSIVHDLKDEAPVHRAYQTMYSRYRKDWGNLEFYGLKAARKLGI
jgi:GT2 family glycosyltransferase